MRPQSIKICGVRSPVRHMPWRSFSAAREEEVTDRVVLRGTSGMIRGNSGIMRIFFLSPAKGDGPLQGAMDGLDVPFSKHADNNTGEMRLVPGTADYRAVPEQKGQGYSRTEVQIGVNAKNFIAQTSHRPDLPRTFLL